MLRFKLTVVLQLLLLVSYAQIEDSTIRYKKNGETYSRNDYVENMTRYIQLTPLLFASRNHFEIQDQRILSFEPNEAANIGIRLQHRWLGVAISYAPRNIQEDIRGRTDYMNLQLNSYGKKVGFDIYYTNYNGYYIENYKKFPELDSLYGHHFPLRPDISTTALGANFYYIFNQKKYSYRSTFIQNERQKKSAGSFMLNGSVSYFNISGDSTIIHPNIKRHYEPAAQFKEGEFYSVSILPGYAHTFVAWQRFYFTFSAFVGIMGQYQSYGGGQNGYTERFVLLPRGLSKSGFGYNGKKFYTGFSSMIDTYDLPLSKKSRVTYVIGSISFFVGMRIAVPPKLKKYSDALGNFDPLYMFHKH